MEMNETTQDAAKMMERVSENLWAGCQSSTGTGMDRIANLNKDKEKTLQGFGLLSIIGMDAMNRDSSSPSPEYKQPTRPHKRDSQSGSPDSDTPNLPRLIEKPKHSESPEHNETPNGGTNSDRKPVPQETPASSPLPEILMRIGDAPQPPVSSTLPEESRNPVRRDDAPLQLSSTSLKVLRNLGVSGIFNNAGARETKMRMVDAPQPPVSSTLPEVLKNPVRMVDAPLPPASSTLPEESRNPNRPIEQSPQQKDSEDAAFEFIAAKDRIVHWDDFEDQFGKEVADAIKALDTQSVSLDGDKITLNIGKPQTINTPDGKIDLKTHPSVEIKRSGNAIVISDSEGIKLRGAINKDLPSLKVYEGSNGKPDRASFRNYPGGIDLPAGSYKKLDQLLKKLDR